ncbi:hypothetical protein SDC9_170452 [bioreactor metagenome]|uniref:Uncharacterized protein n=1 Tax=bioreactor metagenome TaxID=1076179 RepID=A0A645G827_9ZZZZ
MGNDPDRALPGPVPLGHYVRPDDVRVESVRRVISLHGIEALQERLYVIRPRQLPGASVGRPYGRYADYPGNIGSHG